jgi:hypothetical protein
LALVKLALFATAGWTEVGGLQRALGAWLPGVDVERKFPAASKPPKRARGAPPGLRVDAGDQPGLTGDALVGAVLDRLHRYPDAAVDAILLVDDLDDLDGRLGCDLPRAAVAQADAIAARVRQAVGRDLPVFVVFASPEVEAWFLVCWEQGLGPRGLGSCVPGVGAQGLRYHLAEAGVVAPSDGWEWFGCETGSPKLSDALASALATHPAARVAYSKPLHGASALAILPIQHLIERTRVAGPGLAALLRWAAPPEPR